jgi:type VI secretion system protein ImpM
MRCGLYGKLPAKRDFVAISAPREFLDVWEPWLQGSISASRLALGNSWQSVFLRAPIWRFWLGAGLSGVTTAGAFMPSVDGVGRYFPLTAFAYAEGGAAIPPPEFDTQDGWFETVERLLLSALDEAADFEAFAAEIERIDPPSVAIPRANVEGLIHAADGTLVAPVAAGKLPAVLAAARMEDHAQIYGSKTFWWTAGGDGFPPRVVIGTRMPPPHLFTGMLTGSFERLAA